MGACFSGSSHGIPLAKQAEDLQFKRVKPHLDGLIGGQATGITRTEGRRILDLSRVRVQREQRACMLFGPSGVSIKCKESWIEVTGKVAETWQETTIFTLKLYCTNAD